MSKFKIVRKLDLGEIDGWKDCYIKLTEPTVGDVRKVQKMGDDEALKYDTVIDMVKNCFVDGKGFDGEKIIKMNKEDVDELPISILNRITDFLLTATTQSQKNTSS
jgi:hypothetical protein